MNIFNIGTRGMCINALSVLDLGPVRMTSYVTRLNEDLVEMRRLVNEGYEIEWSANEHWCKINGKVFNVSKSVYELRMRLNDF